MSDKLNEPCVNTDRELWREPPGDYYASSIHVTESGGVGINVGGHVIVMPLRGWHEAAKDHAAAEERGRRQGVEEAAKMLRVKFAGWVNARHFAEEIDALAPRDSGKVEVCRAEVASRMPDYSHYECTLPKGHSGAHREGGAEWTDKDTVIP